MMAPHPLWLGLVQPATPPFVLTPVVYLGMVKPAPGHLFANGTLCSGDNLQDFLPCSQEGTFSVPQCLVGMNFVILSPWPIPGYLGLIQTSFRFRKEQMRG